MRPPRSSFPRRSAPDPCRGIATLLASLGLVLALGCSALTPAGDGAEPASSGASGGTEAAAAEESARCPWWQPWCAEKQNGEPIEEAPHDGRFWSKLVGKGRFKVRDAGMYGDGQEAYKRLRQEEALNAYLDCQGVPSYIEVLGVSRDAKPTADLIYRGKRTCGTVRVEPSQRGYLIARPIRPCAPPTRGAGGPKPTQVCDATEAQQDECLFEEWREDCRELCKRCKTYPWCEL